MSGDATSAVEEVGRDAAKIKVVRSWRRLSRSQDCVLEPQKTCSRELMGQAIIKRFACEEAMRGGAEKNKKEFISFFGGQILRKNSLAIMGIEPMTLALLAPRSNQLS